MQSPNSPAKKRKSLFIHLISLRLLIAIDDNDDSTSPLSSYSVSHERDRVVGVEFRLTVRSAQPKAGRIISGLAGYYP